MDGAILTAPPADLSRRRSASVAAGDLRDVVGDVLRLLPLEQASGHQPLAGATVLDRVDDPLGRHLADLVEARTGHAAGVDGREAVAARAGLAEDHLAALLAGGHVLGAQRSDTTGRLLLVGQDETPNHEPEADVDRADRDLEEAAAAREVRLAGAAGTAPEGDEQ